jgi:DNA-binding PadR family transcriptional regulator
MYELMILGQLMMHKTAHGYLIARIINDSIGPYARVSNGRLYPLLTKLEQSGLIERSPEGDSRVQGDRQLRVYRMTESGKQRFSELMKDTSSNPGEYQKLFLMKSFYFDLLPPLELLTLIDHYIHYCQTHILHHTTEAEDIVHRSSHWDIVDHENVVARILATMEHMINQWKLELDWAKSLKAKEITRSHRQSDDEKQHPGEKHVGKRA